MAPFAWYIIGLSLAAAGLIAAIWALLVAGRARGRPRCPGSLRPRWLRPLPRLSGCWYDLSGAAEEDGVLTCPECGRRITRRRDLFHRRRRWGIGSAGLAAVVVGTGVWVAPMLRASQWYTAAPTTVLLAHLDRAGAGGFEPVGYELMGRQHEMWDWQQRWQARLLCRFAFEESTRTSGGCLIFMQGLGVNVRPVAPALVARLADRPPDDRDVFYIVRTLGRSRWRPGAAAILAAVDRGDIGPWHQDTTAWALGACGDPAARDYLLTLVSNVSDEEWVFYSRRYDISAGYGQGSVAGREPDPLGAGLCAVVSLARIGADDAETVAMVERIAGELDPAGMNIAARGALSVLAGDQPDLPHALAAYLAPDQPLRVRIEAVVQMLELHDELAPVVPQIVQALVTSSDALLTSVSCRALARAGSPGRRALKRLEKSEDDVVAQAATKALGEW